MLGRALSQVALLSVVFLSSVSWFLSRAFERVVFVSPFVGFRSLEGCFSLVPVLVGQFLASASCLVLLSCSFVVGSRFPSVLFLAVVFCRQALFLSQWVGLAPGLLCPVVSVAGVSLWLC